MIFAVLLAIPLLVGLGAFIGLRGFSLKEFLCTVGVQIVVAGAATGIVRCENTTDTEIWNGVVTRKDREVVSCRHSYQCHCHEECSGSGKNRSCNEECDTCYEHAFDVDWTVHDSTGEEFDIATVDSQGLIEPARWDRTVVGEPTSTAHSFTNYVKAAPGTLFRHQGLTEKYAAQLPAYPGNVFDYWRINRFVSVGLSDPDAAAWNDGLSRLNGDIGASKQANVIVVAVKGLPQEYFSALEESWVGGKKNDVVLVAGVDEQLVPQWASVMAWSSDPLFQVKLRDDVMAAGAFRPDVVLPIVRADTIALFHRKPMKDFAYLAGSVVPTRTEWIVSLLVSLLVCIGLTIYFANNDPFGDERTTYRGAARRRSRYP